MRRVVGALEWQRIPAGLRVRPESSMLRALGGGEHSADDGVVALWPESGSYANWKEPVRPTRDVCGPGLRAPSPFTGLF